MARFRLAKTALLGLVILGPAAAHAAVTENDFQIRTTGDFVALCSANQSDPLMTPAVNFCQGYAVGVYQTLQEVQAARRQKMYCVTGAPPTRNEAIANFVAWARATPDELTEPPADAIFRFLMQRFPCAAKG